MRKIHGSRIAIFFRAVPALLLYMAMSHGVLAENHVREHRAIMVMGTFAEVTIYGDDESKIDSAMERVFEIFADVDSSMSLYKKESELSMLNKSAHESSVRASSELMGLIEKSIEYSKITGGAFDVTVGPLMEIWGFIKERKTLPDDETLRAALDKVGSEKIVIDNENRTVRFSVPGMAVDLGGIAKGYAVDMAVDELRKKGIDCALINLGGNIYALGSPPGETGWEIGVRDPLDPDGVVETLRLKNQAVATSGDYEKFIQIGPDKYSHIIDPRTGFPASGVMSVTVTADSALETDALSTAFFVLGYEISTDIINRLNGVDALFVLPDSDGNPVLIKIGKESTRK